ncbi:hypothetical protein BJ085DRAFT_36642, partial [Dimargaris cristalligena]
MSIIRLGRSSCKPLRFNQPVRALSRRLATTLYTAPGQPFSVNSPVVGPNHIHPLLAQKRTLISPGCSIDGSVETLEAALQRQNGEFARRIYQQLRLKGHVGLLTHSHFRALHRGLEGDSDPSPSELIEDNGPTLLTVTLDWAWSSLAVGIPSGCVGDSHHYYYYSPPTDLWQNRISTKATGDRSSRLNRSTSRSGGPIASITWCPPALSVHPTSHLCRRAPSTNHLTVIIQTLLNLGQTSYVVQLIHWLLCHHHHLRRPLLSRAVAAFHDRNDADAIHQLLTLAERHRTIPQKLAFDRALATYIRAGWHDRAWLLWQHWLATYVPLTTFAASRLLESLGTRRARTPILAVYAAWPTLRMRPDRRVYHCLIAALGAVRCARQAWAVYRTMVATGVRPDRATYSTLLNALLPAAQVRWIQTCHGYLIRTAGLVWDAAIYIDLICAYARCRAAGPVRRLYIHLQASGLPITAEGYTRLLGALGYLQDMPGVLGLFHRLVAHQRLPTSPKEIQDHPSANVYHVGATLTACLVNRQYDTVATILRQFDLLQLPVSTPLLNLLLRYALETRQLAMVSVVWDRFASDHLYPDTTSYRHLVSVHCTQGQFNRALGCLVEMDRTQITPRTPALDNLIYQFIHNGKQSIPHLEALCQYLKPHFAELAESTVSLFLNLCLRLGAGRRCLPLITHMEQHPRSDDWDTPALGLVMLQLGTKLGDSALMARWVARAVKRGWYQRHFRLATWVLRFDIQCGRIDLERLDIMYQR